MMDGKARLGTTVTKGQHVPINKEVAGYLQQWTKHHLRSVMH